MVLSILTSTRTATFDSMYSSNTFATEDLVLASRAAETAEA